MDTREFDWIVIGGGSAGYAAARSGVELGLETAVVDGSEELGGLCILRGCMPSKTLIQSANRLRSARRAAEFGLRVGETGAEVPEIIARKRELIADFAGYRQGQLTDGRFELLRGRARFVDASTLEVQPLDGSAAYHVRGRCFCIATGSTIQVPPFPGLAEVPYWSSDDVLEAEQVPERVAVFGGGAIALEMACYFEGLGREVTVIQRSERILTAMDADLAEALTGAMEERGIRMLCGRRPRRLSRTDAGVRIELESSGRGGAGNGGGGGDWAFEVGAVLVATGRKPVSGWSVRGWSLMPAAGFGSTPQWRAPCRTCLRPATPAVTWRWCMWRLIRGRRRRATRPGCWGARCRRGATTTA